MNIISDKDVYLGMGVNHVDSCGAVTSTVLALGLAHGFSDGIQSGVAGLALGAGAMAVIASERRRAENEGR